MFAESNWAMGSALGTGLAYAAANLPFIFQAQPRVQALCAAAVSLAAAVIVPPAERFESPAVRTASAPAFAAAYGILFFGILVWFDSAAFYVIQHTGLKVGTWTSKFDLWRNAAVHLLAATAAGVLMKRVQFFPTLGVSFVLLAAGGMSANHPESRAFTGWLYPAGVSLYSACLVAFPAFRLPSQPLRSIAVVAAVLYAFSGWICSGLGIGMAQNLMRIPWQFVALSGIVLAVPAWWAMMKSARRELAYGSIVVAAASLAFIGLPERPSLANSIERGRAVYVEEGCINCHSQFVKPGSRDELLWGPVRPIEELTGQVPPLFGNRRQGPDLVNIGNRRSREWLRLHFIFPRELSPGSVMPAYDYLFSDERGDALVEYLLTLKSEDPRPIVNWAPAVSCAPDDKIKLTFQRHCAACHGSPNREATIAASANFRRQPPDLSKGPFVYAPPNLPSAVRRMQIARIIKFGIAGTDMPGHEYFNDETTFALTDLVEEMSKTK
jgi:cytochrome c oxidase cbb3-type subunit 2